MNYCDIISAICIGVICILSFLVFQNGNVVKGTRSRTRKTRNET